MKVKMENIKIVLVKPKYSQNIGAVARAMKNMNFSKLVLIDPEDFSFSAYKMAKRAEDVLNQAEVIENIEQIFETSDIVIGSTSKERYRDFSFSLREIAKYICFWSNENKVSILFGREDSGLNREILLNCDFIFYIPSSSIYPTLNLAQAVMIFCYEIFSQNIETFEIINWKEFKNMCEHLQKVLFEIKFLRKENFREIMMKIKKIFLKANLNEKEVKIIRGILRQIENLKLLKF